MVVYGRYFLLLAALAGVYQGGEQTARRRTAVVEVFESARNSVVNISSTQIVQVRSPLGFDSLFEDLFDLPPRVGQYERHSVGSGFVLHASGYIVTNAHVVARTAERKVIFADERKYDATIEAIDRRHDLAILKIDTGAAALEPIKLGTSSDLMVGETVIAIGNALGYQHTVTSGVVSALNRKVEVGDGFAFDGLIQTDASINPGNSGGPLLNVLGDLIGINTAIRANAENIGFAIPVDRLRTLLPQMLRVERRANIVTGLRVSDGRPCLVTQVAADSAAAEAGLQKDDRITRLAGQAIEGGIDYQIAMVGRRGGEPVKMTVVRGDQTLELTMTPAQRPKPDGGKLLAQRFGVHARNAPAKKTRRQRTTQSAGLMVTKVEQNSPAARIGIRRGDVIVMIGRHPVANLDEAGRLLEQVEPGQTVSITSRRVSGRFIEQQTRPIRAY